MNNFYIYIFMLMFWLYGCTDTTSNWKFKQDRISPNAFSFENEMMMLKNIRPVIIANEKRIIPDSSWIFRQNDEGFAYDKPGKWKIQLRIEEIYINDSNWLQLSTSVTNLSDTSIAINYVIPFETGQIQSNAQLNCFLKESFTTRNHSGMIVDTISTESYSFAGFTNSMGNGAFVVGFTDLDDAVYRINVKKGRNKIEYLSASCDREGVLLDKGETLIISNLIFGTNYSLAALMDQYGKKVAETMDAASGKIQKGWCSWNYYYDNFDLKDVNSNLFAIENSNLSEYLNVIQVDEGWYFSSEDEYRVRGDYYENYRFPGGMRSFTDSVKLMGSIPGIWVAPFVADRNSELYKQHSEIFLLRNSPEPTTILDLSNPVAREQVYATIKRLVNDYGFEYLKLDFLNASMIKGNYFDRSKTTVQNYVEVMRNVKKIAGDRYILACGAPLPPSIGLVNGMRIGFDVSTNWSEPSDDSINNPFGYHGLKPAANQTLWRIWMHDHFWNNDPDCILVRDYNSIQQNKKQKQYDSPGLTYEEARMWVQLIWLSGNNAFLGENLPELAEKSPERLELLKHSFPCNTQKCTWIDWYENSEIVLLKSWEDIKMVGIFNLSDESVNVNLPAVKLDLKDWCFYERISGNRFQGDGETITFPEIPPHGGRVWILDNSDELI